MEQEQSIVEKFEKFTWKIENFSRLKIKEVCSQPFVIGGYPWKITLFPKGSEVYPDCLAMYLDSVQTPNMSEGWSRNAKFKLLLFNQLDSNMTIKEDFDDCDFNASASCWGDDMMKLDKLNDPNKGFIVEDACIVGAEVYVCKSTNEKRLNQAAYFNVSLTFGNQIGHMAEEVPRQDQGNQVRNLKTSLPVSTLVCIEPNKHTGAEFFSPSSEELMDFSSVGQIEEICSDNPSFDERPSKRSRTFTDFAFAALGRVLYFLKTTKLKDMNDQACKDLQVLWDELAKFKFDLTLLEPQVQYALEMKSYVEKALQLEKLKENMVTLELETERLKVKFAAAELNLDREKDMLKEKGYEERDLDSVLGCGSWRP